MATIPDELPISERTVVATYCATFLAADMRHIYRQVIGLEAFQSHVITRKRQNEEAFPRHHKWVTVLPKPRNRFLRRLYHQKFKGVPWPMNNAEVRDFLYAIQRHGAEVLHIYFGNIAVQLLPVLKTIRHPVVVSFHGADAGADLENPAHNALMREVFQHSTLVLARSESLLDRLRAAGCPEEKLRLQRTAIPLSGVKFKDRQTPPENGEWKIFQACRLVEKKGLPVALEVFKNILTEHPNTKFEIAGDGPLEEQLKAQCQKLGIADKVEFLGFLDQKTILKKAYRSHLFMHPSQMGTDKNQEGVPNAMLEAMATGLPAIATRHGGIPEAIDHAESGMLSDERDVADLTKNSLQLMADPALYKKVSLGARQAIEEKFEFRKQIRQLESHYREAIAREASS
ncbi:MAG: colanic acid/amylovoran biosynthesis glycosyltransferase [Verrucomicrobiales bacterium]|jgi:colanic acid/amylovoran biosynthesis glycosyltransferase